MADNNQKNNPENEEFVIEQQEVNEEVVDNNSNEDSICRICLETITEASLTDTCFHPFCYDCLTQWSNSHDVCPFCRHVFRFILANYLSNTGFRVIEIVPHLMNFGHQEVFDYDLQQIHRLINEIRENQQFQRNMEQIHVNLQINIIYQDPNSIQYIQSLQTIADTEQLIDELEITISDTLSILRNRVLRRALNRSNANNLGQNEIPPNVPENQNPEPDVEQNNNPIDIEENDLNNELENYFERNPENNLEEDNPERGFLVLDNPNDQNENNEQNVLDDQSLDIDLNHVFENPFINNNNEQDLEEMNVEPLPEEDNPIGDERDFQVLNNPVELNDQINDQINDNNKNNEQNEGTE